MDKAKEARIENDKGAMKDAASLKATNLIQEYMEKKYVSNQSFAEGIVTAGDYVANQIVGTEGGYTYTVSTKDLTVADTKGNTVTGTILDNGNISWSDGSSSGGNQTPAEPLEIGDTVTYSTSLNGVTLDNWKVFLSDENYTYIILDGYLQNSAISSDMRTNYNLENGYGESYTIKSTSDRTDLISAMTTKSNWRELITNGKINGIDLSNEIKLDTQNVFAIGAPNIELWINSWNSKYNDDELYSVYSSYIEDAGGDGWYIGTSANPDSNNSSGVNLSDNIGYSNSLYFHNLADDGACFGYWLSSPSARSSSVVMFVDYEGSITGNESYGYYDDGYYTFRPVICLPTSVLSN